jgi:hypothetical protein
LISEVRDGIWWGELCWGEIITVEKAAIRNLGIATDTLLGWPKVEKMFTTLQLLLRLLGGSSTGGDLMFLD